MGLGRISCDRNNDELVATWGNLANRVLSFAYKHWEGVVPDAGRAAPARTKRSWPRSKPASRRSASSSTLCACELRLSEAMRLASEVNKYLDNAAPWFEIKTDHTAGRHDDLYRPALHRLAQDAVRALPALHQRAPAHLPGLHAAIIWRAITPRPVSD